MFPQASWYIAVWSFFACVVGKDKYDNCSRYVSFGYGYKDFFEIANEKMHLSSPNHIVDFQFYVKTGSNAHVLLTNEVEGTESIEIVIGGGSNTFSQIRMRRNGLRKTLLTEKTEDILSGEEYKRFRVSINEESIIVVELEDEDFLTWKLDDLFPIKYFAFGSWTNTKADWRYGCDSRRGDSEGMLTVLTPLERLKRSLLLMYDPSSVPVDPPEELEVKAKFLVKRTELDEFNYQLVLHGNVELAWRDKKLQWKPENYDGIYTIFLPQFQIWTPSFVVLNGLMMREAPLLDTSATGVIITNEGSVFWRPPFKSVSFCRIMLRNFPFDSHNCSVYIGFWNEPENLRLTLAETEENYVGKSERWNAMSVINTNDRSGKFQNDCGVIHVTLERGKNVLYAILSGTFLILNLEIFFLLWLDKGNKRKYLILCPGIALTVNHLFVLGAGLRLTSEVVPFSVIIYASNVGLTCLLLVAMELVQLVPKTKLMPKPFNELSVYFKRNPNRYGNINYQRINTREIFKRCILFFYLILTIVFFASLC